MKLVDDYKSMGGRVTVGSDSSFIWKIFGFGYIEELEMLQEAGFHPLEIIRAATMDGATTLAEPTGQQPEFGIVRPGMIADLVIAPENPLANLKTLYGTGHQRLSDDNVVETVGGIEWTISRGVAYNARELLADVRDMVDEQRVERESAATTDPVESTTSAPASPEPVSDAVETEVPADDSSTPVLDLPSTSEATTTGMPADENSETSED